MATLKKRRGKWYSRVLWYNDMGQKKERQTPLRTTDKTEAYKRNSEVTRFQNDIIQGLIFEFPWMMNGDRTKVKETTLIEEVGKWINRRKKQPDIRESTIQINQNGINHLYKCLRKTIPLKSITTKSMDVFRDYLVDEGLSRTTINIHLRTIKTFFRYCWKRGIIDRLPMIEMLDIDDSEPIYITDNEFQAVMDEVGADSFYGRVFFFYRETGLRLREPFISSLDGEWLDIPNTSKGKRPRSIELNNFLIQVYKDLRRWADTRRLVKGNRGRHLSKKFKKTLRKITENKDIEITIDESKHFHSLRHTFAVRKRVMGVPLPTIQALMGHRSITTTEVYAKIELKKLRRHFGTLVTAYNDDQIEAEKVSKSVTVDTDLVDTRQYLAYFSDGRLHN